MKVLTKTIVDSVKKSLEKQAKSEHKFLRVYPAVTSNNEYEVVEMHLIEDEQTHECLQELERLMGKCRNADTTDYLIDTYFTILNDEANHFDFRVKV